MGDVGNGMATVFLMAWTFVVVDAAITVNDCPDFLTRDKNLKVFGTSCFRFEFDKKLSYYAAQRVCTKDQGTLVMPKSKYINSFLANQLYLQFQTKEWFWIGLDDTRRENSFVWKDGSRMTYNHFARNEGPTNKHSHHTEDCIVIDPSYGKGKWRDQPCNSNKRYPGHYFICQYPVVPKEVTHFTTTASTTETTDRTSTKRSLSLDDCPKSLVRDKHLQMFENSCYVFEAGKARRWQDAESFCRSKAGFLATIDSIYLNTFIRNLLRGTFKSTYPAWIGLNDRDQEHVYKWADGSPMTFNNFDKGEGFTNPSGESEDCVLFDPQTGKWRDINCRFALGPLSYSICEFPLSVEKSTTEPVSITTHQSPTTSDTPTPTTMTSEMTSDTTPSHPSRETENCPPSLVRDKHLRVFGSSCYLFESNAAKNGYKAQAACLRKGGYLASVSSLAINTFLENSLLYTFKSTAPAWIGLNDIVEENVYTWADGTPMTFYNFGGDHGWNNPKGDGEDCVVLNPQTGKWRDVNCLSALKFTSYLICEFPLNVKESTTEKAMNLTNRPPPTTSEPTKPTKIAIRTTTTTPAPLTIEDCPRSLIRDKRLRIFGFSCYLFESIEAKSGYGVQAACNRKGGHLASVNSASANTFVQNSLIDTFNTTDSAWIGLNDLKEENVFTWADGSPMTFYNFDSNEGWSNSNGKGEDCVVIDPVTGKWRDINCLSRLSSSSYYVCEFTLNVKKSTTIRPESDEIIETTP